MESAHLFFLPFRCTAYRKSVIDYQEAAEFTQQMVDTMLEEVKEK